MSKKNITETDVSDLTSSTEPDKSVKGDQQVNLKTGNLGDKAESEKTIDKEVKTDERSEPVGGTVSFTLSSDDTQDLMTEADFSTLVAARTMTMSPTFPNNFESLYKKEDSNEDEQIVTQEDMPVKEGTNKVLFCLSLNLFDAFHVLLYFVLQLLSYF